MSKVYVYFLSLLLLLMMALPAVAQKRVALVIGNAKYQHATQLKNPLRDAAKIADLLNKRGFEVVHRENLTLRAMRKVLKRFKRRARGSDIALLYFSGHGMEMQGDNYLIPIDAELARDDEVEDEAITLDKAQKSLRGASKLRLVILDACRNNPFSAKMTRSAGLTRSVSRGFAPVRVEGNVLVAFAAKAGTVAYDGDGKNSPFAGAMLKHLFRPGLDIRRAFGYVRDDVRRETGGRQDPFLYGSLGGDIVPLAPGAVVKSKAPPQLLTSLSEAATEWASLKSSTDAGDLQAYIAQFGKRFPYYGRKAKKRLRKLKAVVIAVPKQITELAPIKKPSGDPVRGKQIFKKCKACHKIGRGAKNGVGPHLNDVFGERAALNKHFRYSKGLLEKADNGLIWSAENLSAYLANPRAFIRRTKMAFAGIKQRRDRQDLIIYLAHYSNPRAQVYNSTVSDRCIMIGRNIPRRIKLSVGTRFCDVGGRNEARVIKIANRIVIFLDNGRRKSCAQGRLCAFNWPVKPMFRIKARADAAKRIAPQATMEPR